MDAHARADFLRDRNDLAQEPGELAAQFSGADVVVLGQRLAHRLAVVAALGRRQAGDQIALDLVDPFGDSVFSRASASAMRAAL